MWSHKADIELSWIKIINFLVNHEVNIFQNASLQYERILSHAFIDLFIDTWSQFKYGNLECPCVDQGWLWIGHDLLKGKSDWSLSIWEVTYLIEEITDSDFIGTDNLTSDSFV